MNFLKKFAMISLPIVSTYFACNYFFPEIGNKDNEVMYSENPNDSAPSTESMPWKLTRKIASDRIEKEDKDKDKDKDKNFFSNTYEKVPDKDGLPKLKYGKRYYNEALMAEVSTSANLEEIRPEDE